MAYNSKYSGVQVDALLDKINNIFDLIYSVGSIYMSMSSANPSTLFGGTWQRIGEGRTLIDCGSSYAAGSTGGSATHTPSGTVGGHTLTASEVPAHTHTRGTMNITGSVTPGHSSGVCWIETTSASGAFYTSTSVSNCGKLTVSSTYTGDRLTCFDASRNWTGETSSAGGGGSHDHGFTGTSQNTMPPYLATYIWKRTA